jgi:hypothetical protein
VDQSERNRLRKLEQALLLAVSDMEQAIAAAQALTVETDGRRARALETAIAVCYMRPFTGRRPVRLPDEYVPSAPLDAQGHAELKTPRNKVYAHTDRAAGGHVFVEAAS